VPQCDDRRVALAMAMKFIKLLENFGFSGLSRYEKMLAQLLKTHPTPLASVESMAPARKGSGSESRPTKRPHGRRSLYSRCWFDQTSRSAGQFCFRRYAMKPTPQKPRIIMAQVDGSGMAEASVSVGCPN
jgi:hypothetical protein